MRVAFDTLSIIKNVMKKSRLPKIFVIIGKKAEEDKVKNVSAFYKTAVAD